MFRNKKIKFAIIGCGRIFSKHYEIFEKKLFHNFELTSVCEKKPHKLKKIKKNSNLNFYKDYKKLIKNEKIDVVVVLTESGNHYDIVKYCLEHDLNIIVEKPLCLKLNQANNLIKISKKKNKKIFVVMQNRYNLPVELAKKFMIKKKLGKIINITVRVRWSRNQKYYDQDSWRGTWKKDGGALTNQGIHHLDLMCLFGGDIKEVFGYSSRRLVDIEAEDNAMALVKFKNGALGNIEVTTATRPRDLEGSISILGEKGTIVIGGFAANKIEFWEFKNQKNNILKEKYFENPKNVYGFGHKSFYTEVRKELLNKKNRVTFAEDTIPSLRLLHSIYTSIEEKKIVKTNSINFRNKLNNA